MTGFLECGRIACGRGRGRSGNKRRPCSGGEFIEDGVEGRGGRGVFIEDGARGVHMLKMVSKRDGGEYVIRLMY